MAEWAALLETARRDLGLSHDELWFRYFELGGMSTALEVEAYLYGALTPSDHDRDIIAVALNERFSELGRDHPIRSIEDEGGDVR
jgi:hypothetical protein